MDVDPTASRTSALIFGANAWANPVAWVRAVMRLDDRRARPTVRDLDRVDAIGFLATFALMVVGSWLTVGEPVGLAGIGLAVVGSFAALVRRVWPARVLIVLSGVSWVWLATGHGGLGMALVMLAAMATVGDRCQPALTIGLTAWLSVGAYVFAAEANDGNFFQAANLQDVGWFVFAATAGLVLRSRRVELAAVAEREAERREAEASSRVTEERLRIAQELHDTVGHTVATVTMQAEMAAHVIDSQPREAAKALTAIAEVSRNTLQEIRTTLGLLRSVDDQPVPAERSPTPSMANVEGLFDVLRSRGVDVRIVRKGDMAMPSAVSSVLYRITQEAVTNIAKHGLDVTTAELRMEVGPNAVVLVVRDDGRSVETPAAAQRGRHGLEGMRERAQAMGGTVSAQYRGGIGFEVLAVIPTNRPDIPADRSEEMVS